MRIARRLLKCAALPLALDIVLSPAFGTDILQCVPYARALSGVAIRGDAWTWWDQAKGRYERGSEPRPGAVIALADTDVMPLGHVAVVSRILDSRRILLRHANWSAPGLIERDVLAVDSSAENDWSKVRIWWGQDQRMGARSNPVNGFIYPHAVNAKAVVDPDDADLARRRMVVDLSPARRFAQAPDFVATKESESRGPRLAVDPSLFARDTAVATGKSERTLAMVMHDVRREAGFR